MGVIYSILMGLVQMEDQHPGRGVSVSSVKYYITFTNLVDPLNQFLGVNGTLLCMLNLLYNNYNVS